MKYIVDLLNRFLNDKRVSAQEKALIHAAVGALNGLIVYALPDLLNVAQGKASFNLTSAGVSALLGAFVLGTLSIWFKNSDPNLAALLDAYDKAKQKSALDNIIVPGQEGNVQLPAMSVVLPMVQAAIIAHSVNTSMAGISTQDAAKAIVAANAQSRTPLGQFAPQSFLQAQSIPVAPPPAPTLHDAPTNPIPVIDKEEGK